MQFKAQVAFSTWPQNNNLVHCQFICFCIHKKRGEEENRYKQTFAGISIPKYKISDSIRFHGEVLVSKCQLVAVTVNANEKMAYLCRNRRHLHTYHNNPNNIQKQLFSRRANLKTFLVDRLNLELLTSFLLSLPRLSKSHY